MGREGELTWKSWSVCAAESCCKLVSAKPQTAECNYGRLEDSYRGRTQWWAPQSLQIGKWHQRFYSLLINAALFLAREERNGGRLHLLRMAVSTHSSSVILLKRNVSNQYLMWYSDKHIICFTNPHCRKNGCVPWNLSLRIYPDFKRAVFCLENTDHLLLLLLSLL